MAGTNYNARGLWVIACDPSVKPSTETGQLMDEALAVKGITGIPITAERGQIVAPPPESSGYLGFIFARGRAPARVVASLRSAHKRLHFKLRPEVSLRAPRDG